MSFNRNTQRMPKSVSIHQICAVPFRRLGRKIEFCVITSSAGRWKFPKGFIEPGDTHAETAIKEAHEEAGLRGRVKGETLGYYKIDKEDSTYTVAAVLMEVTEMEADWQESDSRQRRWVTPKVAHKLISEPDLHDLLDAAIAHLTSG